MLASQLIYTSWRNGNSTTKGYMVYSKSTDISKAEETEICAVMKYKAPDNLPYVPTEEEIRTLFPKIFAYFKLSSGRFCIAQSSYIGQDYTGRWGNYIIHAYVLDDIGDLIPSKIIGADIFRTRLTEEELNADAAPEFLPQINIENTASALTEEEVKRFFENSNRCETLKELAQSAYNAVLNKTRISLFDDLSNMRMWITALGMILPKNILNQIYFSTYAIENFDQLTIICKQGTVSLNSYSQSYVPSDLISIYANQSSKNDVTIGCYIDAVCNKLISGYYDGILCANSVNQLMLDYACTDFDLAYKLTYLRKGDLEYVSSNDELLDLIGVILKHENENLKDIFNQIFSHYNSSEMYSGDASSIAVLKTLYPHISQESKFALLMMYVDKKLESSDNSTSVYTEIKKDCPCEWSEAVTYFLRQSFVDHFGQRLSNAVSLLLCNSFISIYQKCNSERQKNVEEQICALYARQVSSHDMKAITCVLDSCKSVNEILYYNVYKSIYKTLPDSFGSDDKYLFEYLRISIDNGDLFWSVLINANNKFPALQQKYIERFIAFQTEFASQISSLIKYADQNPPIRKFLDDVNMFAFEKSQTDTLESLMDAYNKYITHGIGGKENADKCKVIFTKKIKTLFENCGSEDSIKYAIALYDNLYRGKEFAEADKDMLSLISETIYNDNKKNIAFINKCLSKTPIDTIVALMNSCKAAGLNVYPRAQLMYEGYFFEKATGKDPDLAKRAVKKMFAENGYTFLSEGCSANLVKEFIDAYMCAILKVMYIIYNENEDVSASELMDYFLIPVSKKYTTFAADLLKGWREDTVATNENMNIYFLYIFQATNNEFKTELRDILEEYLVGVGRGKRNALFGKFLQSCNDSSYRKKMAMYIQKFNNNHMNFWDKLKRIFSIKKEEEFDDEEE